MNESIPELLDLIEYLGNGRYRVPSATVEGIFYTVSTHGRGYCDCPAFKMCWHIRVCRIRQWKIDREIRRLERMDVG